MKFLRIHFALYPSNVINEFASSYQKRNLILMGKKAKLQKHVFRELEIGGKQ